MGRTRGGGGGGANHRRLRDRIKSASNSCATVEELVDHLRSKYDDYARLKHQPFHRDVESIFHSIRRGNDVVNDSNNGGDTPITKKRRRTDEAQPRNSSRSGDVSNNNSSGGGGSYSSVVASASSLEEEDEEVSASSGEYDLMKSMVRENLSRKAKRLRKGKEVKEDVEMEIVDNKGVRKMDLVNDIEGRLGDVRRSKMNKNDNNGVKGPMFKDLGGMSGVIEQLKMEVIAPLLHDHELPHTRRKPKSGILLHGPPGCGKTMLAEAIANEAGLPFYQICATELVSGVSGESEENIRELFSKAYRTAPSIVFIDEIDSIASKKDNMQREMERRIVTQLMTCMSKNSGSVVVIGATNRPDAIDGALRRPGRFDREIYLGVPDESARIEILSVLTHNLDVEADFDLVKIARSTPGFVGADLENLADKVCDLARNRILYERMATYGEDSDDWWRKPFTDEEKKKHFISMKEFELWQEAAKKVQSSSKREGFSAIPNVTWDDVGGLSLLRHEFDLHIAKRVQFPEEYEGVDLETGFLLYGPPGCGKTLIAKAVANESGANFIHIKGPEILNKYVGESESELRKIFNRARTCSPCIIFFDEFDALATKRGTEGGSAVDRLVNQLLAEMDGAEDTHGVYVIGATNRPNVIDPALLREGRIGKHMYVPLPTPDERGMILKALARKKSIDADVDLMAIAQDNACENFSGAQLKNLMNKAALAALEERLKLVREKNKQKSPCRSSDNHWTIKNRHFKRALEDLCLEIERGKTIFQSFV